MEWFNPWLARLLAVARSAVLQEPIGAVCVGVIKALAEVALDVGRSFEEMERSRERLPGTLLMLSVCGDLKDASHPLQRVSDPKGWQATRFFGRWGLATHVC